MTATAETSMSDGSTPADGGDAQGLMSAALVRDRFTTAIYSESHGAFGSFLGAGYLYYGCAAALRSQVSVCIGSGGGFVPDLLAQAQRDLKLSPAVTYLVDANLPDLGFGSPVQPGGWLRPESEFLQRADGIFVLKMLSKDAAALFARQGIQIDYLHIDGDHSARGVIADFEDFAPLLSARAIVSLHDLYLPSVQQALDHIRTTYPNWDFLPFGEVGVGSAFMRCRPSETSVALPQADGDFVDPNRRVLMDAPAVEAGVADSTHRAQFERWHYLQTAAYRGRYSLIADMIDRPGGTVVEVGGFPNSVVDVLRVAKRLIAMEPYAPGDYVDRIEGVARERGIEFRLSPSTVGAPLLALDSLQNFALVWLGLDLTAACEGVDEFSASLIGLLKLVSRAEVVAIELPDHVPSALVWRLIQDCLAPQIERDVTMDLSADPVGEQFHVTDGRSKRRIVIFKASNPVSPLHDDKIAQCAERLQAIKQRNDPSRAPGSESIYRLAAAELPSNLGTCPDGTERLASAEKDQAGCFTYGPYLRLPAGYYRATIRYASPAEAGVKVGSWDVCVGAHQVIEKGDLAGTGGELADCVFTIGLEPQHSQFPVEVRIYFAAVADLRFAELVIEKAE